MRGFAQIQIADVPGQRSLPDLKAPLPQQALKILLAGDGSMLQHIQDRPLPQCFIHNE
jgi:hypothetical protein